MGTVFKDLRYEDRVVWSIRYRDANGRTRWEKTDAKTRSIARRILADRENAVEKAKLLGMATVDGLIKPAPATTLQEFVDEKFTAYMEGHLAPSTRKRYESILKTHLLPALGRNCLNQISEGEIHDYANRRKREGAKDATRRHELAVLSCLFSLAQENKLVRENPVSRPLSEIRPNNVLPHPPTKEQEVKLLEHCSEPLKSFVIVAIETGMRASEQRLLTWDNVDLKGGTIYARNTKDKEDRIIPVTPRVRRILLDWWQRRKPDSPYVFTSPKGGPYDRFNNTLWRRALKESKIGKFRWHDLRASYVTRLAQDNPLAVVMTLTGHSTYAVAKRYLDIPDEAKRTAVAKTFGGERQSEPSANENRSQQSSQSPNEAIGQ